MGNKKTVTRAVIPGLLLVLLVVGTFARELRYAHLARRYEELQTRIVDEVRSTADVVESLQNALAAGGSTRTTTPDAAGNGSTEPIDDAAISPQDPLAFFRAVDVLLGAERQRNRSAQRASLLEDGHFHGAIDAAGLTVDPAETDDVVLTRGDRRYFTVTVDQDGIEISGVHGQSIREPQFGPVSAAFIAAETEALERHIERLEPKLKYVQTVAERADVRAIVQERNLRVSTERAGQSEEVVRFRSADQSQTVLLRLSLESGRLAIGSAVAEDIERAHEILLDELHALAAVSDEEVLIHRSRTQVEQMLTDNGFRSLLSARGLRVSSVTRDTAHFIYYDISRGADTHVGAFGIQRTTGDIWVVDDGDVPIMSLRRLAAGRVSSSESDLRIPASVTEGFAPEDRDGLTVLLLGANEGVADSIMMAHVDSPQREIHFVSIPRDLFYRGARVNGIYQRFGMDRMVTEMSRITGLSIDHYVMVDMYAFIDVVNILGGITVTLDEDLVDPTYRVRENGNWSTLYYPAGEHHLDGVAALRVARSRFTTTDFGRARRQQDIIDAIRTEVAQLGLRDVGTLYTLVHRVMNHVDTDLSPVDVVRYVQQYGRYRNTSHHVLSTDNVLYATYSALHYTGKTEDEVDDDFDLGAWILLPHEGNWDLIPWYIQKAITDGEVDLEQYRVAAYLSALDL